MTHFKNLLFFASAFFLFLMISFVSLSAASLTGNVSPTITGVELQLSLTSNPQETTSVFTDSNGIYSFPTLLDNISYTLVLILPPTFTAGGSSQNPTVTFNSGSGQVIENFSISGTASVIFGKIFDVTEVPLDGVTVTLSINNMLLATTTTVGGTYVFNHIAPRSSLGYILSASKPSYGTVTQAVTSLDSGQALRVDFVISDNPTPGTIIGQVINSETNLPISNALIEALLGNNVRASNLTDGNGNYTLTGLVPDSYTIRASATNFQTAMQSVAVTSSQTITANFALQPLPGSVTGLVTISGTSTSIQNATIDALQGNIVVTSTLSDASGNYTITGLAPGIYILRASAANFQTAMQSVIVAANQTTTANFILQPLLGSLTGQVTNSIGTPIQNAVVDALQENIVIASTITSLNGNYTIIGLAPGDYIIRVSAIDFQTVMQSVVILSNQTNLANFVLESLPSIVTGRVLNSLTEAPIAGAFVHALQNGLIIETTLTDMNGNYTLAKLTSGNYLIEVSAARYETASQVISLPSNHEIIVDFRLVPVKVTPSPPKKITIKVLINKFATQADRIYRIKWKASSDPSVISYYLYRNGKWVETISANHHLSFDDHNRKKGKKVTYQVTAVNTAGQESIPISASIK